MEYIAQEFWQPAGAIAYLPMKCRVLARPCSGCLLLAPISRGGGRLVRKGVKA